MIWVALGSLTLLVVALLLRPLVFFRRERVETAAGKLAIYGDQLKEIEREQIDGLLAAEDAAMVRLEIERRMLTAARADTRPRLAPTGWRLAVAMPLVLLLITGPLALYLAIGKPALPDRPFAGRDPEHEMPDIATAMAGLRKHLAEQPGDAEGWALLARSEMNIGHPDEAAEAYEQAVAHADGAPPETRAQLNSAAGEAQVMAAGGTVSDAAKRNFVAALAIAPQEPRSRFYLAVGREQAGDREGALADYLGIIRTSPADAPWQSAVHERALQMAAALGRDPASLGLAGQAQAQTQAPAAPPPSAGPAAGPLAGPMAAAIAGKSPEEQKQFIQTMVAGLAERLKANPDDIDGWQRLARSYTVLGQRDKAREALASAAEHAPNRADLLIDYAHAIYGAEDAAHAPPPEFMDVMRRVLKLDPNAPEALWFVANDEANAGNAREARELLDKLLAQMPPNAPARATVQRRVDELRAGPRRPPG